MCYRVRNLFLLIVLLYITIFPVLYQATMPAYNKNLG